MAASSATRPNPYVELLYSDLHPSALKQTEGRFLGSPAEQIEAALTTYRLLMINHAKAELRKSVSVTGQELLRLADLASQLYLGRFTALVGPSATTSYIRAYAAADAGDVPMDLIYALANQHAERMGKYFHETSKDALAQGFNRMVNKGVPARVAAERALDAFGLTPRQMNGYVALDASLKTHSSIPRNIKAQTLDYIGRSIRRRLKIFGAQEEHNLTQQAQQVAWMWLLDKGKLSAMAEKVWITARDERTCSVCRPMHGKRVGLTERFMLPSGEDLYVPGAHVNCRCSVRLVDPMGLVAKADFEEALHPRARDGKFKEKPDTRKLQGFLDSLPVDKPVEEKPVIHMGSVSMRPISMRPISMSPIVMDKVKNAIDMGQEKKQISMPAAQAIQIKLATARVTLNLLKEEPVRPSRRRVFYKETHRLEQPVYAVIGAEQVDPDGKVALTGEEEFVADRSKVALEAANAYHQNIEKTVGEITDDGLDYLEEYDQGGNSVYFQIPLETLYDIVAAVASNEVADLNQNHVHIDWQDHMGHPTGQPDFRTWGEIARELGIDTDDFKVYVMRVDEGHNGKRGDTTALSVSKDKYSLTGNFNTVFAGRDQVGHSADITLLNGEPDTPMEEFGDNPDD